MFMGISECLWMSWVFMGVYGCRWVLMECLWIFMGIYRCPWVCLGLFEFVVSIYIYMGSWVSWVPIGFRCLWIFMGVMAVYGCLLGFMDFWVSMGTYGWHECLWVLYLNIENISYFIIQEPQKIWKFQKTSEITHLLWKIAYGPRRRETLSTRVFSVLINKVPFSPLVHNILFYIKVVRRCFTVTRTTSRAVGKGWTHVWSKIARVNGGGGGGGKWPG